MKKYYLMAPGPTPVPSQVLLAMARPIVHHRTPEYEALFGEVRERFKWLIQTRQETIVLVASGTGAMEAAVTNTLSSGDRALVVRAGKFGERWAEICATYGVQVVPLDAPYGQTVPADRVAEELKKTPGIRAVFCQHSETSTGVLHDVQGYAEATRQSKAILVVDAVSSLGVADLPMDAWGVDVVVSGSQKGLMLPPGLAFCTLSDKAWDQVTQAKLPRYYFNLLEEKKLVVKNQPHFTPAVSIVVGLKEVLAMLQAEGLANVFKRHDRLARATRAGVEALGLELFAKAAPSPAITAICSPKGIEGERVVATYAKSHNITIAGGQGEMKGKVFRLGHMGYVGDFDVVVALGALEQVLAELGYPVDWGTAVGAAQKVLAERPS
jgi:aspartate aminotransferase-like enzyme